MKSIAVFCGANKGNQPWFAEQATILGQTLAERGILDVGHLVFYASATLFFLFMTVRSLENQRSK